MRQAKLSSLATFAGSALAALVVCDATTASAQDVARGLQRFTEMECSECHGIRTQGAFKTGVKSNVRIGFNLIRTFPF